MSETNAQEPTMEEILASIRRIISEDDAPQAESTEASAAEPAPAAEPHPVASPPAPEEDVLELTQPVDPPAPKPAPPEPVKSQSYEETLGDLDVFSTELSSPPPAPTPAPAPAFDEEPLVGSYAAETSAGHFGALARSVMMPKEGRTLEDVVREMLKPLLADWLDKHLTSIVEARVQAEVERIARRHDY